MKRIIIFLLILLTLCAYIFPQQPKVVGIRSEILDSIYEPQKAPMWCWAACCSMALRYYGVNVSQEDIVFRVFGSDYLGRLNAFAGGNSMIITNQLNNWQVVVNGRLHYIHTTLFRGSPNANKIIDHLSQGKIIIVAYGPGAESGHVVLLSAVGFLSDLYNNSLITDLIIRDPDPSVIPKGRRVQKNFTFPYPVQWVWIVDIT